MREAEYGGAAFMVPSKQRPEIVARIKEIEVGRTARGGSKHLTNQEIADTAGISERQVRANLRPADKTGISAESVEGVEDVDDAEIVEDEGAPAESAQNAETGPVAADPGAPGWSAAAEGVVSPHHQDAGARRRLVPAVPAGKGAALHDTAALQLPDRASVDPAFDHIDMVEFRARRAAVVLGRELGCTNSRGEAGAGGAGWVPTVCRKSARQSES